MPGLVIKFNKNIENKIKKKILYCFENFNSFATKKDILKTKTLFKKIIKYLIKNVDPMLILSIKRIANKDWKLGKKPDSINDPDQSLLDKLKFIAGVNLKPSW